jgi:hypothetical protein
MAHEPPRRSFMGEIAIIALIAVIAQISENLLTLCANRQKVLRWKLNSHSRKVTYGGIGRLAVSNLKADITNKEVFHRQKRNLKIAIDSGKQRQENMRHG